MNEIVTIATPLRENLGSLVVVAIWALLAIKFGWQRAFAVFVMFPPLLIAFDLLAAGESMLSTVTATGTHG